MFWPLASKRRCLDPPIVAGPAQHAHGRRVKHILHLPWGEMFWHGAAHFSCIFRANPVPFIICRCGLLHSKKRHPSESDRHSQRKLGRCCRRVRGCVGLCVCARALCVYRECPPTIRGIRTTGWILLREPSPAKLLPAQNHWAGALKHRLQVIHIENKSLSEALLSAFDVH